MKTFKTLLRLVLPLATFEAAYRLAIFATQEGLIDRHDFSAAWSGVAAIVLGVIATGYFVAFLYSLYGND